MTDLDRWLKAASDTEHRDYRPAMRALAQRGPEIAAQVLEVLKSRDGYAIMPVISRWPSATIVEQLAPLLLEKDHAAAWRAATLLGRSRDPAAVPILAAQLGKARRRMAAQALGEAGLPAAIAPLQAHAAQLIAGTSEVEAMADEDPAAPEQLAHVIHALGRLGDDSLAPWLVRLADTAPEPQEREAAVAALADVPVAEALRVVSRALNGSTGPLREAALRTLWSYRTVAAVDAVLASSPPAHLVVDLEAMLHDIGRATPTSWAETRASLPAQRCLVEGQPLTPAHLLHRARDEARRSQALAELARIFGVHPRWDAALDDDAALLRELTEWQLREAIRFAPGTMYRQGREVPEARIPRPLP